MRVKNWRKIAWAIEGSHGTYNGVTVKILEDENFGLSCVRHCRNSILERWNNRRFMARVERRISRREKRDRSNNATKI
jgi:hypothetical protein